MICVLVDAEKADIVMLTGLLFPGVRGIRVDRMWRLESGLHVRAVLIGRHARCPGCHRRSTHLHSHYERTLRDCPCGAAAMTVYLRTRRFRCRVPWCRTRIFTERRPDLAAPWSRRTQRLQARLTYDAFALGGEAGARHARAASMPISARTMVRMMRAAPLPAVGLVSVLGIDDWAKRRGCRYGTILVDLETHRVIDLLPDRTVATVAAWLSEHPELAVISRDRSGAYAEAARLGAPQAIQVADRFHIVKNVTDGLERYLMRRHRCLRRAGQVRPGDEERALLDDTASAESATPTTNDARLAQERRLRRLARYDEIVALHTQGYSLRSIARDLQRSRDTVRRFVRGGSFPERQARAKRATMLTPWLPYLRQRWDDGCQNATQLWRELGQRGFPGGRAAVARLVQTWRPRHRTRQRGGSAPRSAATVADTYTPRRTCWLLLADAPDRTPDEQAYLDRLYDLCPQVALVEALVREFRTLVAERDVPGFYRWLHGVEISGIAELRGIARGIWRDRQAVEAALTLPWSQGQTEGQVNRLKLIKRCGSGRANVDLLRRRVLYMPPNPPISSTKTA